MVKSIVLETDHKALVPHVSSNTLDQVLSWSQRFRMRFHFKEINRVPEKEKYKADAILRLQARDQMFQSTSYDKEIIVHVASVISSLPGSATRLQQIMEAQEENPVCS